MAHFAKKVIPVLLTLALISLFPTNSEAQSRAGYRGLISQSQGPPVYMDFFTLPGETAENLSFVTTFRIPYTALPFRRRSAPEGEPQFYSTATLSIEVFRGSPKDLEKPEDVKVRDRQSVGRSSWSDSAYAEDYPDTQSREDFLEGVLEMKLQPGVYVYVFQMSRGMDADEQLSRARAFEIHPYDRQKRGNILFGTAAGGGLSASPAGENGFTLPLLNIGNSVRYAADYRALIHLPGHSEEDRYELLLERVALTDRDTTRKATVHESSFGADKITGGARARLMPGRIAVNLAEGSHSYAVVDIPNSRFPNDSYRLSVRREGSGETVAKRVFRSLWPDMPASLLNLEVSIDMLRFIADDSTVRSIGRGSRSEMERKFREFWDARDPTPDTEYNELMAEYYRRVDYAWREFTTPETPGFETDQGRIYIRYGEPQKIERSYPSGEPTTEIWIYPDRKFIFRATSGFGDFRLVNG